MNNNNKGNPLQQT